MLSVSPRRGSTGTRIPLINSLVSSLSRVVRIGVVDVHKHRVRFVVGGCMAEFSDVVASGLPTRTIAVESEDPAAVAVAVRDLGLAGYLNINYPTGLRFVIDAKPARYAVIDVGTNSVKFHLGERADDASWRTVVDRAEVTRLGEGLEQDAVINSEALEGTAAAIAGMVDEAKREGALAIISVGTAGLRIARNREDVIEAIRGRTGITVEVITGEEESRLAYVAVQASLGLGERITRRVRYRRRQHAVHFWRRISRE